MADFPEILLIHFSMVIVRTEFLLGKLLERQDHGAGGGNSPGTLPWDCTGDGDWGVGADWDGNLNGN